ncbi:hypothetical protein [Megalodesulfovibrio gigas]|uniref:Uncharacterized protein n=1 Tax=Megalodesulfovibrio gigas (strain ATCC 19364 / DSM 1382 / NCIMB 9332 / VKM B-1759) TaxID=1121448 RepID=T2GE34_MEGG1|nr:hypothetical protein [Megalodesulfovibrio gigas]AGW14152.1 hypothetical protein DGI_2403 [Megalodesulfovibrio gigas DSM 1382 = ATCC 19364]
MPETTHLLIDVSTAAADTKLITMEQDPESEACIRVFAACQYALMSSCRGTIRKIGRDLRFNHAEYLTFTMSDAASLQYVPADQSIACTWIGVDHGQIWTLAGSDITLSQSVVGVLLVEYAVSYDRWQLPVSALALPRIAVVASCRDALASLGIDPESKSTTATTSTLATSSASSAYMVSDGSNPAEDLTLNDAAAEATVYLHLSVINKCTQTPIANAYVQTSLGNGYTDAQGYAMFGPGRRGQRVTLRITSPESTPSYEDVLHNDWVTL